MLTNPAIDAAKLLAALVDTALLLSFDATRTALEGRRQCEVYEKTGERAALQQASNFAGQALAYSRAADMVTALLGRA